MTADRPAPPEGALEKILRNRPALYDPDLIAAARAELEEMRATVARLTDPGPRSPLSLHFDEHGHADAIDRNGTCFVHLRAGTERTVCNAPRLVEEFNSLLSAVARLERERDEARAELERVRGALSEARGLAAECLALHPSVTGDMERVRVWSGVVARLRALAGREGE